MGKIQDMQYKKEHMHDFDRNGIHKKTGTEYDNNGFDWEGYNSIGFNRLGIDKFGFTVKGKNTEPFYDYDVAEMRERQREGRREFKNQKKQEKKEISERKKSEINRLESKLSRLRNEYLSVKNNSSLSEGKKMKHGVKYMMKQCSIKKS